jgi:hypothetical protein
MEIVMAKEHIFIFSALRNILVLVRINCDNLSMYVVLDSSQLRLFLFFGVGVGR